MIPRILHQTWKTDRLPPRFQDWSESWTRHNPAWEQRLWSDRVLLELTSQHYPALLPTFCSYDNGVMRADAARYMLLHRYGGVYADIDSECVAPLDPLLSEDRAILCREPMLHTNDQVGFRLLPYMLFNGVMASPPGHPFWLHVLANLPRIAESRSVLDASGPCMLTSAHLSFSEPSGVAIHPPALFCPLDRNGHADPPEEDPPTETYAIHHWAGTWYTTAGRLPLHRRLRRRFHKIRHALTRGPALRPEKAQAAVDPACLGTQPPKGGNVAILVPLRDAADLIEPFLTTLARLDYPKDKLKLVFCEGDSKDDSWERLNAALEPLRDQYRDIVLLRKQVHTEMDRARRWSRRLQRKRRAGLARVRNHLIREGLNALDDWALWIDIDVWRFPADVLETLIATGRRIVVPHCVRVPGGPSFDWNSFVSLPHARDDHYWKAHRHGIFQPKPSDPSRYHLSDLRHLHMVDLHGVGGTMLLVDASLHRGGLHFPERPYRNLIETEAFGLLARDLGVVPAGLPQVEILHVPW